MKIILDAYQYTPAITGTDRMAYNFITELQRIDKTNQYYVLCSQHSYIPTAITASNFKVIRPPRWLAVPVVGRLLYKLWRHARTRTFIALRADVFFSFHNMRLPNYRLAKKMVASNLDLIPLRLDEYKDLGRFSPAKLQAVFERVARQADKIMSISQFSKRELCDLLHADESKVEVIYLAADPKFSAADSQQPTGQYPPRFILTIGGSEPRKNVQTVADAYNLLPPKLQAEYPLLIAGGKWHGKQLEPLQVNPHVRLLGYVSEDDLAALYKQSSAFVFASRYEGFGFTILEAMASGTPVISANSSSLPEVTGDAALLFAPDDTAALSQHLKQVLTDSKVRQRLTVAGTKQTKKFSWSASAQKLHQLLTA